MTHTTIGKQTFNISLGLRRNSSNNHRKCSKHSQRSSERHIPNSLPMTSPKSEYCNFRHNGNPQRHTRPRSHIYIGYPKVLRCCCLFPKQSSRNKPNTKSCKQRRIISSGAYNFFKMGLGGFACLPVNKTNSLEQLATSKRALLKIFHSCL
jgi:hypothetical protein